jgi:Zn-dependent protease with chaperone function
MGSDGERSVLLRLEAGWLAIDFGDGSPIWWRLSELQATRLENEWRIERVNKASESDPYLLTDASSVIERIAASKRAPFGSEHREGGLAWLAAFVLAAAMSVYGVWTIGVPWFAGVVAGWVPVAWEERLGEQVVGALAPASQRCGTAGSEPALEALTARLRGGMEKGREYRYRVVVADSPVFNAFAAPGGFIVLNRGMVEKMETEDQLAAVLAHEMTHVAERHSTRAIFRAFAVRALLSLLIGDVSALLVEVGGRLGDLHYSRTDEDEADRQGQRAMAKAGFDPLGMAEMLGTPAQQAEGKLQLPAYLSSHPDPAERVRRARERAPDLVRGEPSNDARRWWREIRGACGRSQNAVGAKRFR